MFSALATYKQPLPISTVLPWKLLSDWNENNQEKTTGSAAYFCCDIVLMDSIQTN